VSFKEKRKGSLLKTTPTMRTDDAVIRTFIGCTKAWLDQSLQLILHHFVDDLSTTLKQVVLAQQRIGWENIFKGRLSIQWATMYNHIIQNTNHGLKHPTAEKWGKKV
jgi:hypothetical protein